MLLMNGVRDSASPFRRWGTNPGGESEGFVRSGPLRNFHGEARVTDRSTKASRPSGLRHPYTWVLASKNGALASRLEIEGTSSLTAAGALGRNLTANIAGTSSFTATGQLVVSATASIAGTSSMTGNLLAAVVGTASISGTSSMTGTLTAKGSMAATIAGTSSLSATSYATGRLAATITPFTELSPQSLANAVWEQALEAGYTAEDMMRVMAAALAGEVSGAGTATITIRDIADTKSRIVASVDGSGNRTAVTLDPD